MKKIERATIYSTLIFLCCLQIGYFMVIKEGNRRLNTIPVALENLIREGVDKHNTLAREHNNMRECLISLESEVNTLWNHHYALYKITEELHGGKHD